MTEQDQSDIEHDRATCPECGMLNVTVVTAPRKPPKMYCTNCQWDSLTGESEPLLTDGGEPMKSIECPNCGMPYTAPEEADHWSCDCGASWELDPRTDGGAEAFDPANYESVREALRDAPAGYGVESIIDYFDPVVEGGHEVDADD